MLGSRVSTDVGDLRVGGRQKAYKVAIGTTNRLTASAFEEGGVIPSYRKVESILSTMYVEDALDPSI